MPINLSVQKLQEPCYKNTFFKNLKTLLLSDLKKEGPNSLTSQGKLSWLCVRCAQPRTTKKPTKKKRNFLANQSFLQTAWLETMSDFSLYTKAKRTLISVKSQPLEKRKNSFATLELYCQASPRLDFNFYPIVRLQNKTWCVLVLLLPLCLSVLFIWQEKNYHQDLKP